MGELTNDGGTDVIPEGGLTVALPGLGELVHANPGLRAWLRHRTCPGLSTDGLPGLTRNSHITNTGTIIILLFLFSPSFAVVLRGECLEWVTSRLAHIP